MGEAGEHAAAEGGLVLLREPRFGAGGAQVGTAAGEMGNQELELVLVKANDGEIVDEAAKRSVEAFQLMFERC